MRSVVIAHDTHFSVQVATAVGNNTVVGKMVLTSASKAIGQSAEGVAGVGEGKYRAAP